MGRGTWNFCELVADLIRYSMLYFKTWPMNISLFILLPECYKYLLHFWKIGCTSAKFLVTERALLSCGLVFSDIKCCHQLVLQNELKEFPLCLSGLSTWYCLPEDVGSISVDTSHAIGHRCSLDPVLPWLWRRPQLQLLFDPSLGTSICHRCGHKSHKKEKKEERKKGKRVESQCGTHLEMSFLVLEYSGILIRYDLWHFLTYYTGNKDVLLARKKRIL